MPVRFDVVVGVYFNHWIIRDLIILSTNFDRIYFSRDKRCRVLGSVAVVVAMAAFQTSFVIFVHDHVKTSVSFMVAHPDELEKI